MNELIVLRNKIWTCLYTVNYIDIKREYKCTARLMAKEAKFILMDYYQQSM